MSFKQLKRRSLLFLLTSFLCSTAVLAQVDGRWAWMKIVPFNEVPEFNLPKPSESDQRLAQSIWRKEIEALPVMDFSGKPSRQFASVLISTLDDGNVFYTFSIMDGAFSNGCTPPGNGRGQVDMYSNCPLRVTATDKVSGKSVSQQFEDYCHLYLNEPEQLASKNHTEILIDPKAGVVKFRVMQLGKVVPACNKTLRYKLGSP